jgi:hypothetical protein
MSFSTNLVQIQIQSNEIFEEEKYCCGCCRHNPHLWELFLSIVVWALSKTIAGATTPVFLIEIYI